MINKEQVITNIGSGWHSYIDMIYSVLPELSFCSGVYLIERKNGMLKIDRQGVRGMRSVWGQTN